MWDADVKNWKIGLYNNTCFLVLPEVPMRFSNSIRNFLTLNDFHVFIHLKNWFGSLGFEESENLKADIKLTELSAADFILKILTQ